MTFCLGMTVREGLVGLADTRITTGNEYISARKVSTYRVNGYPFFLMTSGLRSIRDKTVAYFEEMLEEQVDSRYDRLFKVVNAFGDQVRRVQQEDGPALFSNGLRFDMLTLIGGRLEHDHEHKLFLMYPEANWVEISHGTPYCIIGAGGYGKPVLDRTLKYEDSMRHALKVGCLAFDSTRISASHVDFPIDIVLYQNATGEMIEHRCDQSMLKNTTEWWQERLRNSIRELPAPWIEEVFGRFAPVAERVVGE